MRKLLVFALAAVFAMLSACTTVEPTEISFKYSATVTGHVRYDKSLSPAEGFDVKISVTDKVDASTATFHATTDSEGAFTLKVPCKGKNGIGAKAEVSQFVHEGRMYTSTSKSADIKAEETSSDLVLTLYTPVEVE